MTNTQPHEVRYRITRALSSASCRCGWATAGNECEVVDAGEHHEQHGNTTEEEGPWHAKP